MFRIPGNLLFWGAIVFPVIFFLFFLLFYCSYVHTRLGSFLPRQGGKMTQVLIFFSLFFSPFQLALGENKNISEKDQGSFPYLLPKLDSDPENHICSLFSLTPAVSWQGHMLWLWNSSRSHCGSMSSIQVLLLLHHHSPGTRSRPCLPQSQSPRLVELLSQRGALQT
jgi:hypothetical protein